MGIETHKQRKVSILAIMQALVAFIIIPVILLGVVLGLTNSLTLNVSDLVSGGKSGREAAQRIAIDFTLFTLILMMDVFVLIRLVTLVGSIFKGRMAEGGKIP